MKKILMLSTGGTIAWVKGNEGLTPEFSVKELLHFVSETFDNVNIDGKILLNIDSTNMQPEHWVTTAILSMKIMINMMDLSLLMEPIR